MGGLYYVGQTWEMQYTELKRERNFVSVHRLREVLVQNVPVVIRKTDYLNDTVFDFRKEIECMQESRSLEQNEKNLFSSNLTFHFSYLNVNEEEIYIVCGTELKNKNT